MFVFFCLKVVNPPTNLPTFLDKGVLIFLVLFRPFLRKIITVDACAAAQM